MLFRPVLVRVIILSVCFEISCSRSVYGSNHAFCAFRSASEGVTMTTLPVLSDQLQRG